MNLTSLDTICPDRSDDVLGDGWSWSDRHMLRVNSSDYRLYVDTSHLWIQARSSNQGAVRIEKDTWSNHALVVKMVLLTRMPDAFDELRRKL